MKTLWNRGKKININKGLALLSSIFLVANTELNASGLPLVMKYYDLPLTIAAFPYQGAQVNSDFYFNIKTHISRIRPEIDYSLTNHLSSSTGKIMTSGYNVERIYEKNGDCPLGLFSIEPNQTCIARVLVKKNHYTVTPTFTLMQCLLMGFTADYRESIFFLRNKIPNYTQISVSPSYQDGIGYDAATFSFRGKPTRTGVYLFQVNATNDLQTAAPRELQINVQVDLKDKPVFKTYHSIASAMPGKEYRLNLMDLIEPRKGFMVNNQVNFRIETNHEHPGWLSIDKDNPTVLHGVIDSALAGHLVNITLIAASNTGGDSEPMTITIPVAYDPEKKPVLTQGIELVGRAGSALEKDLRILINDPTYDNNLKLIIDDIKPKATWLKVSSVNPTELVGLIPDNAEGQLYQITLRANTLIGGSSDAETILLKIDTNPAKTPRFYQRNSNLPILYEGQPYQYDFVAHNAVYPDYSTIPYTIELAKDYDNPSWLKIKDNILMADNVPPNLNAFLPLFVIIKNIPGGISEVYQLELFVMQ